MTAIVSVGRSYNHSPFTGLQAGTLESKTPLEDCQGSQSDDGLIIVPDQ